MALERLIQTPPVIKTEATNGFIEDQAEMPSWQIAGETMARFLAKQENPLLLLDVDGVLLKANNLEEHEVLTETLIPAVVSLERQEQPGFNKVSVGLATSRPSIAAEFLKAQITSGGIGPLLEGASVFEQGFHFKKGDNDIFLGHPKHTHVIGDFQTHITDHPSYRKTWKEVEKETKDPKAFSGGNFQWNGPGITFIWMLEREGKPTRQEIENLIHEILTPIAKKHALDPNEHLHIGINTMDSGLIFVAVKGKHNGEPIHKATPHEHMPPEGWIFAADGTGDKPMAELTKKRGGLVVAINENIDKPSAEIKEFVDNADIQVDNAEEFAHALHYATHLLPMYRRQYQEQQAA